MITDPLFYLTAVIAVLINGISKGGFGGGLGTLATPLMALTIPAAQSAGIMLPILCAMDVFGIRAYRGKVAWNEIRICLPGAVLGIVIGAATFQWLSDAVLRILLGALALVFPMMQWRHRRENAQSAAADPVRPGAGSGAGWGCVSGFTSFISHAGGPPLLIYLLRRGLDKSVFVGTTVMFFFVVNLVKVPFYAGVGQLAPANLATSLVLLPLAPLGIWLGVTLHGKVNETWFFRIVYASMMAVGARLVWDGVARLA